jgi:hypothetical protein
MTLDCTGRTDGPAARPDGTQANFEHGGAGWSAGERHLGALASGDDLEAVERLNRKVHRLGGTAHSPNGVDHFLTDGEPIMIDRYMKLGSGRLENREK